jgi:hypothetical protein
LLRSPSTCHPNISFDSANPVEALWSNLKGVELASLAGDTLHEVIVAAERVVQRIRGTTTWPTRSFDTVA